VKTLFKITFELMGLIRADLRRRHPFAHERVGFIGAGLAGAGGHILILAQSYRPVADVDYLPDPSVGAMMGPEALRKALQWAMGEGVALLHVHSHGGRGLPGFSRVDIRENAKFVPDFFKVAPQCLHGAVVLSNTAAAGQIWLGKNDAPIAIDCFAEVGAPIRKWSRR
jgi:hypothetical protein